MTSEYPRIGKPHVVDTELNVDRRRVRLNEPYIEVPVFTTPSGRARFVRLTEGQAIGLMADLAQEVVRLRDCTTPPAH